MQFTLRSLFLIVTGLALFCGAVFGLPVIATGCVLAITLLLSPAVWISGASSGNEGKQAFFRGGVVCGIVPFVVSSYCLMLSMGGSVSAIYSMTARPSYYPVYSNPQGAYSPTAPAYSPNGRSTVAPNDPVSDGSTTSDVTYPNLGDDPVPLSNPSPQSVYVDEVTSGPSFGVVSSTYSSAPYLLTAQVSPPATQGYAGTLGMRFMLAAIWLAPGFFSFCGGAISYGTYRLIRPASPANTP